MSVHPIPDAALDDRLAFVGTAGYGKTYNASCAIERVLKRKHRALIVDPLGVWWGLRLDADGKAPSPFDVVIFGGRHGDLPLNRHAGEVIGETVAGMRESCIVDLSALDSAEQRRKFMLDFLNSLYEATDPRKVEPYHAVFDEADLWAPQKPIEFDHKRLQSRMEEIVRRGRVKGFIPWLITQRPAVLSKDILSQADGLISFRLTSSQDRNALGGWVSGQADENEWKPKGKPGLYGQLATLERGRGLVWLPGRGILKVEAFPQKLTFDSSKTPERGKRAKARELKPLDVERLKDRLSKVADEVKANNPDHLKTEIARLKAELIKAQKVTPAVQHDHAACKALEENTRVDAYAKGYREGADEMFNRLWPITEIALKASEVVNDKMRIVKAEFQYPSPVKIVSPPALKKRKSNGSDPMSIGFPDRGPQAIASAAALSSGDAEPSGAARKILNEIHRAFPVSLTYASAAARAAISRRSSQYRRYEREVRASGEVEAVDGGRLRSLRAEPMPAGPDPVSSWIARLPPSYGKMLSVIAASQSPVSRQVIAEGAGVSVTSSGLGSGLSELMRLDLISRDGDGFRLNEALR